MKKEAEREREAETEGETEERKKEKERQRENFNGHGIGNTLLWKAQPFSMFRSSYNMFPMELRVRRNSKVKWPMLVLENPCPPTNSHSVSKTLFFFPGLIHICVYQSIRKKINRDSTSWSRFWG